MSYLGIFKLEFENTIVMFHTSAFEFFKMKIIVRNKKNSNLCIELPYLRIFRQEFQKTIVILEISPSYFLTSKKL